MDNYVDKVKKGDTVYPIKDTISGYLTEDDHGAIEADNTGYVTGGDVYAAMNGIEAQLSEI